MSRRASQFTQQRAKSKSKPKPKRQTPLGPPFELDIIRLSHDGRGIGTHQGKTVFVSEALPGERVVAKLQQEFGRYSEAQVLELLTRSEQRQASTCVHFGQCGGCQLQHMSNRDQLEAKQQGVLDQLRRFANLVPNNVSEPLTAQALGYRARARLGVQFAKTGEVTLGFRRAGDKQLVALSECPVLLPVLQSALAPLAHWLAHFKALAVTHIELVAAGDQCTQVLRVTRSLPDDARQALSTLADEHNWQVFLQPSSDKKALTNLNNEPVDPRLYYQLAAGAPTQKPLTVGFHPTDFTQVNPALNVKMVTQVIDWLGLSVDEHVWDLFCGVGNFSLPAAQVAGRVVGVEAIDAMVARGRENAAANDLTNIDFFAADLTQSSIDKLIQKAGRPDAILLDPPRDGAREICEQLGTLKRARVLYVSCNPATFARDARILVDKGYKLQRFGVMEMFPQTSHLETMALLVKS